MLDLLKKIFGGKSGATGQVGELAAEKFLKREKGFKICERNWRSGRDEIDLIAYEFDILVFVEVKTRRAAVLSQVITLWMIERNAH